MGLLSSESSTDGARGENLVSRYERYIVEGQVCSFGHAAISGKGNCLACCNKVTVCGYNDFGCLYPHLLGSWRSQYDPHTVYAKSNNRLEWECSEGHQWMAPAKSRADGSGCKPCSTVSMVANRSARVLLRTVESSLPFTVVDSKDLDRLTVSSHQVVNWKCFLGHVFSCMPNRINAATCPVCSNKQLLSGFNDLATARPLLVEELEDPANSLLLISSEEVVRWKKSCDPSAVEHKWGASIASRAIDGTGCQICSGKQIQLGVNDFASALEELQLTNAKLYWSEANGPLDPSSLTRGSNEIVVLECRAHSDTIEIRRAVKSLKRSATICFECRPRNERFRSQAEDELMQLIEVSFPQLSIEPSVRRFRNRGVAEIDLFIDEKIALDFNGSYWHIEGLYKPLGFHRAKSEALAALGFLEYAVEEEDWTNSRAAEEAHLIRFISDYLEGKEMTVKQGIARTSLS